MCTYTGSKKWTRHCKDYLLQEQSLKLLLAPSPQLSDWLIWVVVHLSVCVSLNLDQLEIAFLRWQFVDTILLGTWFKGLSNICDQIPLIVYKPAAGLDRRDFCLHMCYQQNFKFGNSWLRSQHDKNFTFWRLNHKQQVCNLTVFLCWHAFVLGALKRGGSLKKPVLNTQCLTGFDLVGKMSRQSQSGESHAAHCTSKPWRRQFGQIEPINYTNQYNIYNPVIGPLGSLGVPPNQIGQVSP